MVNFHHIHFCRFAYLTLADHLLIVRLHMSPITKKADIRPAKGKLGVLLPGMGAVATTFIAGVESIRRGHAKPIGSMTQMGTIRLGKRTDNRTPKISDFVPLATLDDLVFGGWDIFEDNAYESAKHAGVLSNEDLEKVRPFLEGIRPMPGVFEPATSRSCTAPTSRQGKNKMDLAEQLIADIERFKTTQRPRPLRRGLVRLDRSLPRAVGRALDAGQVRSRACTTATRTSRRRRSTPTRCLRSGVPFANGAPNLSVDFPAIQELAKQKSLPICGKDFKTGQTLMKTILAPGFKARYLGLEGWYSTNILGNRDGEVLDDPESFKSKEVSKLGVLEHILQPHLHPDLYKDFAHVVRINYYPPRGDNKEGWDNIDIFGWLGYKMQIKIDFLCRDSILAAPIVLDLALFMDLAARAGMGGIQEWLSFFFKSPMTPQGLYPEHDLFIQLMKLKNTLRHLRGEELITHLGTEYYD